VSGRAATISVIAGNYALAVGAAAMPAPPGWRWVCLTDIARLESGHTPSRLHPEYWDGVIPWIGIKDARQHHGEIITETLQTVTQDGIDNSAARLLPAGTVCLSRTASVGYVTVMGRPMATSQDFVNWICGPDIDPHFLKLLLIAENESLFRFGKGSTHTTIYYPEVKAFHVCLPPLREQRRIVVTFEALQARSRRAREALDAVPPLLEKLRQSILAAAFRGDLTKDWRAQNPNTEPASALLARIRTERRKKWEES
jgi:type I restriction enzyme S subunit